MVRLMPFADDIPELSAGDHVDCRDAWDCWGLHKVAIAPARYDQDNTIGGKCYLTVPVAEVEDWEHSGPDAEWVNWPAEDVRKWEAT